MPAKTLSISIEKKFFQDFLGLPRDAQKKLARVVDSMRDDTTTEVTALVGHQGISRRRIGDFRVLFAQSDTWLHLYAVQHRGGVYGRNMALPKSAPKLSHKGKFPEIDFSDGESIDTTFLPNYLAPEILPSYGLDEQQISALVDWEGTLEGLESLSNLEIPEHITELLLDHISENEAETALSKPSSDVRLVKSEVLDAFWAPLLGGLRRDHPIQELILVSPWITPWEGKKSSFSSVIKFIKTRSISTRIITRPQEMVNHRKAVEQLRKLKTVEVTELSNLHAKFYVCDMAPTPLALIGSANSTKESFGYNEVGVRVRGRADLENFVRELISLSVELRSTGTK